MKAEFLSSRIFRISPVINASDNAARQCIADGAIKCDTGLLRRNRDSETAVKSRGYKCSPRRYDKRSTIDSPYSPTRVSTVFGLNSKVADSGRTAEEERRDRVVQAVDDFQRKQRERDEENRALFERPARRRKARR